MNSDRRKQIRAIAATLQDLREQIEQLEGDEQDAYDQDADAAWDSCTQAPPSKRGAEDVEGHDDRAQDRAGNNYL